MGKITNQVKIVLPDTNPDQNAILIKEAARVLSSFSWDAQKPNEFFICEDEDNINHYNWSGALVDYAESGVNLNHIDVISESPDGNKLDEMIERVERSILEAKSIIENRSLLEEQYPDKQSWFLNRMKTMGYQGTNKGHCWGMAHMAKQAFLMGDIDVFSKRLKKISRIPLYAFDNDFAIPRDKANRLKIKAQSLEDQSIQFRQNGNDKIADKLMERSIKIKNKADGILATIVDTTAFFDSVSLTQAPGIHPDIVNDNRQNTTTTETITSAVKSDEPDKKIKTVASFAGSYHQENLKSYLSLLQTHLGSSPFSLVSTNSGHAINLNYDPSTQTWLLMDANTLLDNRNEPVKKYRHDEIEKLVNELKYSFFKKNVLSFELSTIEQFSEKMRQDFSSLSSTPQWLDIHPLVMSHEVYNIVSRQINAGRFSFIQFIGNYNQLSHLIREKNPPLEDIMQYVIRNERLPENDKKMILNKLINKVANPTSHLLLSVADNPSILDKLIAKIKKPSVNMLEEVSDNRVVHDTLSKKIKSLDDSKKSSSLSFAFLKAFISWFATYISCMLSQKTKEFKDEIGGFKPDPKHPSTLDSPSNS